jgi:hypothetical protein
LISSWSSSKPANSAEHAPGIGGFAAKREEIFRQTKRAKTRIENLARRYAGHFKLAAIRLNQIETAFAS